MANDTIQTRVSPVLKEEAEALFAAMGLNLSDAIRMFLQQSVNEGGLPFQPRVKSEKNLNLDSFIQEGLDSPLLADQDASAFWASLDAAISAAETKHG